MLDEKDVQGMMEQLRDLVKKHQVCYEVWPDFLIVGGEKTKVGFEIQLFGVDEHASAHLLPGCKHCLETYGDMRQIATWILPTEERLSGYEIEPFDQAFHESPKRRLRNEVALSIKIFHRHGFDQPVDRCEEVCLKDLQDNLRRLGIPRGSWQSSSIGKDYSEGNEGASEAFYSGVSYE